MQGIVRLGGIGRAAPARGRARGGPGGFHGAAEGSLATREARAAGSIASVGPGLLALQETGNAAERDEAAQRRAGDILAELAALQRDMLGGGTGDPVRLRRLVESAEEGVDPKLREVVQGVLLRAQVELLRRGLDCGMSFA